MPGLSMSGRKIMEKAQGLPSARTGHSTVTMTINKGGSSTEKQFEVFTSSSDATNKTLMSFNRPSKIKLLTHAHEDAEDNQWLRMSSGRIKRITSSGRGKSFMNSHFTYEDLGSRRIDDYRYKNLGSAKVGSWDCYKVRSIGKPGKSSYSKTVAYVRKKDFFVVKIDFYKRGKLHKVLKNKKIRKVKGILTPYLVQINSARGKGSTELDFEQVQYNINIANSKFSKDNL